MHAQLENIPFNGTMVMCSVNCSKPQVLEEALVFKGQKHVPPYSYFDRLDEGTVIVKIIEETNSFGSRVSSAPVRTKIENLLNNTDGMIEINMSEVELISSSFADEIFGKIFASLGPINFMQRIKITGMNRLVTQLANRAIQQRMSN